MNHNDVRSPSVYRQLGMRFISRVSHATRQEQWGKSFLQLAWTAGPVTFLALTGGYFFGYGESPPEHLFFYFGGYTLVTGVVSLISRFIYNLTRGRTLQRAEQALQTVMSGLPDVVTACRDSSIQYYEGEHRTAIIAQYILAHPDAGVESTTFAVELLTGDKDLIEAARRIEIYRHQGLLSLCRAESEQHGRELQKACTAVARTSPELARMLYDRMHGRVVSKRTGYPRTQGFLFRGRKAIEFNDPSRMNLTDTIETATLLFELLAGREFPRIELRYKGARYISDAGERLERARRALRAAVNRRNSRLWTAGEHLRGRRSMQRFAGAVHAIHTPKAWVEEIDAAAREVIRSLEKKPTPREHTYARKALQKLRDLEKAEQQLRRLERELVRAQLGYQDARRRLDKKYGEGTEPVILSEGTRLKRRDRVGIELIRSGIVLSKQQQRELAVQLAPLIDEFEKGERDPGKLVNLGYAMMSVLDKLLPIYRWSVQSALERSNAPDLSQLEQGLTSSIKIGWALSLVRELRPKHSEIIHAVARALVDYHGIELSESAIDVLVEEYGASRVYLEALKPAADPDMQTTHHEEWDLKDTTHELQQLLQRAPRQPRQQRPTRQARSPKRARQQKPAKSRRLSIRRRSDPDDG